MTPLPPFVPTLARKAGPRVTDGLPTVQRLECQCFASLISMGSRRERLCASFKKRKNNHAGYCVTGNGVG
jgi:hypothetical protein